ncbi:MAG TPA: hypothetical protein VNG12_14740, partial [Acidimicrobiales bacterium]|nr:hypothetical protein [Acidimicrobiales bacterium]
MTVALLGGLVSVVGACGTGNPRPSSGPAPVPGRVADAVPWHEQGPTGSARHVFTDNLPPLQTAAWVAVPVATLWDQPGFARPIDAP